MLLQCLKLARCKIIPADGMVAIFMTFFKTHFAHKLRATQISEYFMKHNWQCRMHYIAVSVQRETGHSTQVR